MSLPEVGPGENNWQVQVLGQQFLLPDTSLVGGKLVSNALEPVPVGFATVVEFDRDTLWEFYLEVEVDEDPVDITMGTTVYGGTDEGLTILTTEGDSTFPYLRTVMGPGQGFMEWDEAVTLSPPQTAVRFTATGPITRFAFREYVEGGLEPPDQTDILEYSTAELGVVGFNDELGTFYANGAPGEGILLRYAAPLNPAKYYRIETTVIYDGTTTVKYLVDGTPYDLASAGVLAPQTDAPNAYPSVSNHSVIIGPGIGDWARISSGQDFLLHVLQPSSDLSDVRLEYARITETTLPGGGGGGGGATYNDVIADSGPVLSWELDEADGATVAVDGTGNGYDGTYMHPELITYGLDSMITDGSGTAMMLGNPGDREVGVFLDAANAPQANALNGVSYEISFSPPSYPPSHYEPENADDDTSIIMNRGFALGATFSHSGGFYAPYGGYNLFICGVSSNSGSAYLATRMEPDVPHLINVTVDTDGWTTLYVDGVMTPEYTDLQAAIGAVIHNPILMDISGGFGTDPIALAGGAQMAGNIQSGNGAIFDSFHMWDRALTADEVAAHHDAWSAEAGVPADTFGTGVSTARATIEISAYTFVIAPDTIVGASSSATATATTTPAQYTSGKGSALGRSTMGPARHTVTKADQTPIQIGAIVSGSYIESPPMMTMKILDDVQERTPTALTIVLGGAVPGGLVKFYVGSKLIAQVYADASGSLSAVSITLPEMPAGSYTLNAVSNTRMAADTFTLRFGPTTLKDVSPDADPVEVPGALRPDGTRSWVLQDLLPGGLGSYIFVRNPNDIQDRPVNQRQLTSRHATAPRGQHHVFEALGNDFTWRFQGVTFTQEDQEILYAFGELNRRIYLIDQRNRAWIVSVSGVEITPRLRKNLAIAGGPLKLTDWMADYSVTVISHDRTWRTPIPLED